MDTLDPMPDLIQRAKTGDRKAFDELADRYRSRLDALIRMRLGESLRARDEIGDIRQEAFLRAFETVERFRWEGEDSFFRWLGGIAGHVIQEAARRRRRRPVTSLEGDLPGRELSQTKAMRRDERFGRLEEALNTLSPEHRRVILLARVEGLPLREVAKRLGRSREAVRQMLWRALKKLKTTFGDTESLHLPDRRLGEDEDGEHIG